MLSNVIDKLTHKAIIIITTVIAAVFYFLSLKGINAFIPNGKILLVIAMFTLLGCASRFITFPSARALAGHSALLITSICLMVQSHKSSTVAQIISVLIVVIPLSLIMLKGFLDNENIIDKFLLITAIFISSECVFYAPVYTFFSGSSTASIDSSIPNICTDIICICTTSIYTLLVRALQEKRTIDDKVGEADNWMKTAENSVLYYRDIICTKSHGEAAVQESEWLYSEFYQILISYVSTKNITQEEVETVTKIINRMREISQRTTASTQSSSASSSSSYFTNCNTKEELTKRYHKLSAIYHPDNDTGDADIFEELSNEYKSKMAAL